LEVDNVFNKRKINPVSSFLLLILVFGLISMNTQAERNTEPIQVSLTGYRPSGPIQVTGDGDFDPAIWNEDGTSDGTICRPWILDGWEFDADIRAIEIYNTDDTFIIRNCSFKNCDVGILLYSMENGQICENTFQTNEYGVVLNQSAEDTCVSMNIFELNIIAISLQATENINIFSNIMYDNGYGIDLGVGARYTFVKYNNVTTSTFDGIRIIAAQYNLIERNNIDSNTLYGVSIQDTMSNEILENNFLDNNLGLVQGYDDLLLNKWYKNYWTDWISGPYAIDGPGGNSDASPNPLYYTIDPEDTCLCDSCYCVTATANSAGIIVIGLSLAFVSMIIYNKKRKRK